MLSWYLGEGQEVRTLLVGDFSELASQTTGRRFQSIVTGRKSFYGVELVVSGAANNMCLHPSLPFVDKLLRALDDEVRAQLQA